MLIQEKVYHISRTSAEVTFSIFQETICLVFFPWNSFIQPCHIFWCLNLETPLLPFLVFGLLTHFWIDLICRFQIIPIILCLCKPCLYFPIEILQIGWVFWRQKNHNFDIVHVTARGIGYQHPLKNYSYISWFLNILIALWQSIISHLFNLICHICFTVKST